MKKIIYEVFKYLLGLLLIIGGIAHFTTTEFYINAMPDYLPFHEIIVYLSGTEKRQKKKVLKFQIQMQESMFMGCLTLSGKKNIKNNYFSLSLGKSSTKLQGL